MDTTTRTTNGRNLLAALAVALMMALIGARSVSADARDINRNAGKLANSCAQDGGKSETTSNDTTGATSLTCKGGKNGDWKCTGLEEKFPTCSKGLVHPTSDPGAVISAGGAQIVEAAPTGGALIHVAASNASAGTSLAPRDEVP
ncbi:MAG: hypothetical protein ACR2OO_11375 [Thermomicrobiales bacterium]